MMSFNSLIHLFSSGLKSYIDNNQPISNGKFKQEDIDKWRIWHPCPIKPEFWHDNMLNYISFDVSFVDSKPIISMHFTVDDLIITCSNSKSQPFMMKNINTDSNEKPPLNLEKISPYMRIYLKIIENLFPTIHGPACRVLETDPELLKVKV